MSKDYVGRPIKIHSHQYYSEGFLLAIGGLMEHGWFLVEDNHGKTHKYSLQEYWFEFSDKEPVAHEA